MAEVRRPPSPCGEPPACSPEHVEQWIISGLAHSLAGRLLFFRNIESVLRGDD